MSQIPRACRFQIVSLVFLLMLASCGVDDVGSTGLAVAGHPGEQTYNRSCFSCHQGGIAGAPKFGDAQVWAPRIAQGRALLLANTKTGIPPGMPAMGLCTSCTEQDLIDVIDYMVLAASPPIAEKPVESATE
jgi:cytochrome c5